VRVLVRIENDKVTRDEQEYLKIKNFKINIKPKGISIHLKNLFGGDQILGKFDIRFAQM
jgi:Haemolymph juvenile hormone binding protein (JHBP)